jgi:hypothetical protein
VRLFTLIDIRHLILGFFLGLAAAVVIYMVFRFGERTQGPDEKGVPAPSKEGEGYPDGLRIESNPIPPIFLFLVIGFAVWMILYVIFFGILGDPF